MENQQIQNNYTDNKNPLFSKKVKMALYSFIVIAIAGMLIFLFLIDIDDVKQNSIYTDQLGYFSLELPSGWKEVDSIYGTTTETVLFSGSGVNEQDVGTRITVNKYERTKKVDNAIKIYTEEGFSQLIANDVKFGLNEYKELSNATTSIQGRMFYVIKGTYVGIKSRREVTQYLYITHTSDSYYLIGIDVYSDLWAANEDEVLRSIDTFKLLK